MMGMGAWLAMRPKPSSSAPACLCRRSRRCNTPLETPQNSALIVRWYTTPHYDPPFCTVAALDDCVSYCAFCHIAAFIGAVSTALKWPFVQKCNRMGGRTQQKGSSRPGRALTFNGLVTFMQSKHPQ